MRRIFSAFLVALSLVALQPVVPAGAATRPAELNGVIRAERPLGTGSLSFLFLTAYEAALWTDAPQWTMDTPFALTLVYRMSFTTDELAGRTVEEMQKTAPGLTAAQRAAHEALLRRAFPPVRDGDRITALHVPGKPVRFYHNGRPTADSGTPEFAPPFFAIWLSEKTSEPSLRERLLGRKK
jgi:hypothetical protein